MGAQPKQELPKPSTENIPERSDDPLETFSLEVIPANTVQIGDEVYDVLNQSHIDEDREIVLMGLLNENIRYARKYDQAKDRATAEKAAKELRKIRVEIISQFTTVPMDVARPLKLHQQGRLIEIVMKEMGLVQPVAEDEEGEAPKSTEAG